MRTMFLEIKHYLGTDSDGLHFPETPVLIRASAIVVIEKQIKTKGNEDIEITRIHVSGYNFGYIDTLESYDEITEMIAKPPKAPTLEIPVIQQLLEKK